MTAPTVQTSTGFRTFTPKQTEILRQNAMKHSKGNVVFLDEIHFYSQNLKGYTGDTTGLIFWSEKLPKGVNNPEHFFCFFWNDSDIRVTGLPNYDPVIDAIITRVSNTLIYSRAQHDFFGYDNVAVDGGREYTRIVGHPADYEKVKFNLLTKKFKRAKGRWHDTA